LLINKFDKKKQNFTPVASLFTRINCKKMSQSKVGKAALLTSDSEHQVRIFAAHQLS